MNFSDVEKVGVLYKKWHNLDQFIKMFQSNPNVGDATFYFHDWGSQRWMEIYRAYGNEAKLSKAICEIVHKELCDSQREIEVELRNLGVEI